MYGKTQYKRRLSNSGWKGEEKEKRMLKRLFRWTIYWSFGLKNPAPLMTFSEGLTVIRIEFNTAHCFVGKEESLTIRETEKLSRIMSQKRSHIYIFFFF